MPEDIADTVSTKLGELQAANSELVLDSLNFDAASLEFEFDVKVPGISVSTSQLGLPDLNGLTFELDEVWLNVKRKVEKVSGS